MHSSRASSLLSLSTALLALSACEGNLGGADTGPGTPDSGVTSCPGPLPTAPVECTDPACAAGNEPRVYAQSALDPQTSASWIVIGAVSSELFENENRAAAYGLSQSGGLSPRADAEAARLRRSAARRAAQARHDEHTFAALYEARLDQRVRAENLIRAASSDAPLNPEALRGTAIQGRSRALLPKGVHRQTQDCSATAPSCGAGALCVIPSGEEDGTCESSLTIRFSDFAGGFEELTATVRKVGTLGAIVVDDNDTVSDNDVDTLLQRFDERIAPMDHQFFGEPRDSSGKDRDQNGVTIIFLTSKTRNAPGSPVGFFFSDDLRDPTTVPASNGADLLYMTPPGGSVTLDNLSGTLAHEYQHLINYYAKVLNRGSSRESRWLDEALSTFAEDALGYGSDAFANVGRYLDGVSDTSLTGFGLNASGEDDADSIERRGMGLLFVRYIFEQRGGATYGSGPADLTDNGGVAAVRALVQSADTGLDAVIASGRSVDEWLKDLLAAVAVDGAGFPGVSCNPKFEFAAPEIDGYTNFQRGIDLRAGYTNSAGTQVRFQGPSLISYLAEDTTIPAGGGDFRSLDIAQTTELRLSGPDTEDFRYSLIAIPTKLEGGGN